jgi:hypothetical protein
MGIKRSVLYGNPNPADVCTSYVERQNLTMRMHRRDEFHIAKLDGA